MYQCFNDGNNNKDDDGNSNKYERKECSIISPGLNINSESNTFSNIMAGIGLLLLIIWGGLALYSYVTSDKGGIVDKEELKEAEQMVKEKPKKRNPKQFDGVKSDEPFVKTRKKSTTKKTK